jgi:hypothetical protein
VDSTISSFETSHVGCELFLSDSETHNKYDTISHAYVIFVKKLPTKTLKQRPSNLTFMTITKYQEIYTNNDVRSRGT